MSLESDGLRLQACGGDVRKLTLLIYRLSSEWHERDPELHPPPNLSKAQMVARHYARELYGVGDADA